MAAARIPQNANALILVTGATGLIGSATSEEVLKQGYNVRAVTRDATRALPLKTKLEKLYPKQAFEIVEIKDYTAPGAYDSALQGVDGVLHLATDVSFSAGTKKVVDSTVAATVGLMEAAAKVASIKSFVLTSSRIAIFNPEYGKDVNASLNDYAEDVLQTAYSIPEEHPFAGVMAYAASKIEGEKAAWKWYNDTKPGYVFNTVLPDLVAGPVTNPAPGVYSTATFLKQLLDGDVNSPAVGFLNPASLIVDVRDVAAIHAAALLDTSVESKRIWAAAHPFTANKLLQAAREAFPDRTFPPDFDFLPNPRIQLDNALGKELIKRWTDRSDWFSIKDTVVANILYV